MENTQTANYGEVLEFKCAWTRSTEFWYEFNDIVWRVKLWNPSNDENKTEFEIESMSGIKGDKTYSFYKQEYAVRQRILNALNNNETLKKWGYRNIRENNNTITPE